MTVIRRAAAVVGHIATALLGAILLLAPAGLLIGASAPARAQMFQMEAAGNEGLISRRSVQLYAKLLGFEQDQLDTALTLYEGYQAEHNRVRDEQQAFMKKLQEEFEETRDFTVWQKELPKKQQEFAKQMQAAQTSFLNDVKGLCTPAQEEKWPAVERQRKREVYLRLPFVAGVSVDVVDCARRVGMAPEEGKAPAEVKEALDEYEMTLDRKLSDVERMVKDAEGKAADMAANFDFAKIQEMLKKFSDEAILIRNINRDSARRVSALLTDDTRAKFDKEVQRRSYPRVYRTPYVVRAMDAAVKIKGLDDQQKADIEQLRAGYEREATPLNQKWAAAITEREDKEGSPYLAMMNWQGEQKDNPVTAARKARRELDDQFKDRLLALLKDDQKQQLPKEDSVPQGVNAQQMDAMEDFMPVDEDEGEE
ncbi:MAG: hypothetical protein GIKADHBN_01910 [Phycisphaerales bacterium]|nr:hypothetical protein [Phycisphaerales bacterium]